jgi:hypothetical protein
VVTCLVYLQTLPNNLVVHLQTNQIFYKTLEVSAASGRSNF